MQSEDEAHSTKNGGEFEDNLVAIWAKAVDTQMHFNEMSVKSRQLGLTFVAAALGLAVFLFSRSGSEAKYAFTATIRGHVIALHVAEFIILAAAASVYAVKLLDLGVYHKMLRGAVAFGEDLEEVHLRKMLGLNKGMTQAISHFSRNSDAKATSVQAMLRDRGRDFIWEFLDPAFHAFNKLRKENLKLFPRSLETLLELRSRGIELVAYTDSTYFAALGRVERLGLSDVFSQGILSTAYLKDPKDSEWKNDASMNEWRANSPKCKVNRSTV